MPKVILGLTIILFALVSCSTEKNQKTSKNAVYTLPTLKTNDEELDTVGMAFNIAVGNLASNIRVFKSGMLTEELPCLLAGGDYYGPWSRDAAYNCMNAGSLFFPDFARNTLLSQIKKDSAGRLIFAGEYWDNAILGNTFAHYATLHNDKGMWALGRQALINTIADRERDEFDSAKGLFRGGSYFNDGISGYPDLYTRTGKYEGGQWVSNIKKWVEIAENKTFMAKKGFGLPMMCLSTNAIYYQAYRLLASGTKSDSANAYAQKAANLKAAINTQLWDPSRGQYSYFIDPNGNSNAQEAMGLAMVLLTDIASDKAGSVLQNTYRSNAGVPCLWPSFSRYQTGKAGENYGRHSGTVWPHVQMAWAKGALANNRADLFWDEFNKLSKMIYRDKQCREIYHPISTEVYGGMQEDNLNKMKLWESATVQTWTASGFAGMVINDILGFRATEDSLHFSPNLHQTFPHLRLKNLCFGQMAINIELSGKGKRIKKILLNNKEIAKAAIAKSALGTQSLQFVLE